MFDKPSTRNMFVNVLYFGGNCRSILFHPHRLEDFLDVMELYPRSRPENLPVLSVTLSGLLAWFVYNQVQAVYRSPQSSLILAALLSIVTFVNYENKIRWSKSPRLKRTMQF